MTTTPEQMIEWLEERLATAKDRAASGRTTTAEMFAHEIKTLAAILAHIRRTTDRRIAELEVVLKISGKTIKGLSDGINILQSQNARLRDAGEKMAKSLETLEGSLCYGHGSIVDLLDVIRKSLTVWNEVTK